MYFFLYSMSPTNNWPAFSMHPTKLVSLDVLRCNIGHKAVQSESGLDRPTLVCGNYSNRELVVIWMLINICLVADSNETVVNTEEHHSHSRNGLDVVERDLITSISSVMYRIPCIKRLNGCKYAVCRSTGSENNNFILRCSIYQKETKQYRLMRSWIELNPMRGY